MNVKLIFVWIGMTALVFSQACKKSSKKNVFADDIIIKNQTKGLVYCSVNNQAWGSDAPSKKHLVHFQDKSLSYDEDVYGVDAFTFGDTLTLSAARVLGTDSSQMVFEIALTPAKTGSYTVASFPVHTAGKVFAYYYHKMGQKGLKICKTGYNPTGNVTISKYTDSTGLVSGTFNFTMNPKNSSDPTTPKVTITNGQFTDVLIKP